MVKMQFFDKYEYLIKSGKISACTEILKALDRINYYKNRYTFKQDEADKRIKFIESECSNTKGQRDKLKLALPQKVWAETVFGFYTDTNITKTDPETMEEYKTTEERRLIHEVPIVVGRGNGKTTYASAIGDVGQIIDGEYGADIQMLAYSREQAGYLFNANRAMLNNEKSLLFLLRKADKLASTKQGILYRPTNSLMSIKTSDYESLDGTNAHYNIFDEVHTYDDDFIKVVNDGSSRKRKNWITWYITTNGTKRDKVFDKYYNIWLNILDGKIKNDSVMPFIYKLDDVKEIHDPTTWQKANPLLGVTVERESIELDIEMAKNDPAAQAEIMAKTFNLPINNYLAYFTNEECEGNRKQFDLNKFKGDDYRNAKCILGLDLSDVSDICSCSFMVCDGEKRYFYSKKYLPRKTVEQLPKQQREKYEEWESKGLIHLHELDYNRQDYIFSDLKSFMIENKIQPICVGYDKYISREITQLFDDNYGDICVVIPQTVKGLSQYLKIYKEKIKAGNIIYDDDVSRWCHSNVMVRVDHNNNIFPSKKKAKNKIDVFASNLDAFIAYELKKEELQYYF